MSSSYANQAQYGTGRQQPQGYYHQAQASQGGSAPAWSGYATSQPPAQPAYAQQSQQAQYAQGQTYNATGYDHAAYYAQQQQWSNYAQQQQQQQQPRPAPSPQPYAQQQQQQYAQQQQQYSQPQVQQQYHQHTGQQHAYPQAQAQVQAVAQGNANPAYYQAYPQRPQQVQYQQQPTHYQQPPQQQAYPVAPQYSVQQHPAPQQQQQQQPAAYPVQPPAVDPTRSVNPPQQQPVQTAGYVQATAALYQPQPQSPTRPLAMTVSSSTPPRSPHPTVSSRPQSQSFPTLPTAPQTAPQTATLPRHASLPSTSQGSPTKSGGRPLPPAPGGQAGSSTPPTAAAASLPNVPQLSGGAAAPPPPPTRAGTLPDGPVKSFRNRRLPTTPGPAPAPIQIPPASQSVMSKRSESPTKTSEQATGSPRSQPNSRPLPQQPPGADKPTSAPEQLKQQQQQQQTQQAPPPPPKPTLITSVSSAPSAASPSTPASARPKLATDIDDRPPSSQLTRSPQPRQAQPLPETRTQYSAQPQAAQTSQRQSLIMRMAVEAQQQQQQQRWPNDVPPLPRPPRPYVHGRIESEELQDVVAGTASINLDDEPPPARPLSRTGMTRQLPPAPAPGPAAAPTAARTRTQAHAPAPASPRVAVAVPASPQVAVARSAPASPRISVSAPDETSIEVRAPSPRTPGVAVRPPSPTPAPTHAVKVSVPSVSFGDDDALSPGAPPQIKSPPPNAAPPHMVLSIQLDAPEPGPEEPGKRIDVRTLPRVYRGGDMRCGGCGRPMTGRVVSAMGVRWHPHCFKCAFCSTLLEHVSVFTYEDRPFCNIDYIEHFAPRCYHCKTPIAEEQYVSIEDFAQEGGHRFYHEYHFFCAECGDPFMEAKMRTDEGDGGKEYVVHNGHAYCRNCHVHLRFPKCKKCKKPLVDNVVEAAGGKWHWHCLVCTRCEKPFESPNYFERGDKPFCVDCFDILLRNDL